MSEAGSSSPEHSVESGLKRSNEDSGDENVTKKLKTQDVSVSDGETPIVLEESKLEPALEPPKEDEKPAEISQNVELDTSATKIENAENESVKSGDENVDKEINTQAENKVINEHSGDSTSTEVKAGEPSIYLPTEAPPPLIQVLNPILPRVDPRGQAEASNNSLPPGIECGIVKWYDITKGFGFIQREGGGDDVFIHSTSLPPRPGQRGLADKEPVWFKVTKEPQGRLRAFDITGPHGAPLRGVPDSALLSGGFGAPLQHAPAIMSTAPVPPTNPSDFPPHTTTALPPNRQRGFAKWFNIQKGFGFIAPEDGTEDVFCHQSNLLCVEGAFRSLAEKENLEFEILNEPNQGKAKRKAINVTGPGGRPVIGVPRPVDASGSSSQVAMPHGARPFQPPILGSRGAPFGPPGLPQTAEARPPADYAYYSQYMAAHGHPPQQPQPHSFPHQHPQFQQQQQHQYQQQQQQYQQQMQHQQYQQNPEHAAAWAAYYAAQAAAGPQGQPVQQQSEAPGQQASMQNQPDQQQTAEHQAAWQAYYAQVAALQAQQQAQ